LYCYVGTHNFDIITLGEERIIQGFGGGKRPLGRPRCRWEHYIEMDLHEVGWGAWTGLMWLGIRIGDRTLVYAVVNFRVP